MKTVKRDAIHALLAAAHHCPGRLDQEAFWEYQNRVMEPLRENIRQAVKEEEA
jgi:hypothetical protein